MCIACVIQPNEQLTYHAARNGYCANPHGAGFAYIEKNKVIIKKGYFDFETFWEDFDAVQQSNDLAKLAHFRIATSGQVDEENCHPWKIDSRHVMIHNGMIGGLPTNNEISDTGVFTEEILKSVFKANKNLYKTPAFNWLVSNAVGSYNKIAILSADGTFTLYNKGGWTLDDGVYYSNLGYLNDYDKQRRWRESAGWNDEEGDLEVEEPAIKSRKNYRLDGHKENLTARELHTLTHTYSMTVRELIDEGVIICVMHTRDEEEMYDEWLKQNNTNNMHQLSESEFFESEHYSG